jgi:adenylate kinase family enzyme
MQSAGKSGLEEVVNDGVLFIDCSDDEMRRRLLSRGREDDKKDVIDTRISQSHREFAPVISFFESEKKVWMQLGT